MIGVTDSNIRADALVVAVLGHYGIGDVTRCRLHTRGLNDTYDVATGDGAGYFLRVYQAGRGYDEIMAEVDILGHLVAAKVPVCGPVARRDGSVLTALECAEGRRWAGLFTAAPGKEIHGKAYTPDLARQYGAVAAAIHGASDKLTANPARPALDLAALLDQPAARIGAALADRPADAAYLAELSEGLRGEIEGLAAPELGFCHGDLHGGNACEVDGVFTVFDFDCCGWGYRAYDACTFPWAFAVGGQEVARIQAMGQAFMAGYLERRPLSEADIAAIPAFVAVRQIWLVGMHLARGDRFGWGWMNDGYFDHQLKVLRDWQANFLSRPAMDWLVPPT